MAKQLITSSQARAWRTCARLHHYLYDLGFRAMAPAEAMAFGTLMHLALEAWWIVSTLHEDLSQRIAWALKKIRESKSPEALIIRAEELMLGYHAMWADEDRWEPLHVEHSFSAPLINPGSGSPSTVWDFGGKLDVLVRDRGTGDVYVVEHKTTSEDVSPGSSYWQRLRIDAQVSTYDAGARALGYDVKGVLYDVLAKPRLEPLKATPEASRKYTKDGRLYAQQRDRDETPDEYRARLRAAIAEDPTRWFARAVVVRLEEERREAAYDLWQTAAAIRESRRLKVYPRNPDACVRYGRTCEFFDVCTGAASLEEGHRFRRVDDVHEELRQESPLKETA